MGFFSDLFTKKPKWTSGPSTTEALKAGMTPFRWFSDLHFFSKYYDGKISYDFIMSLVPDGLTILGGDIIDRICALMKDLPYADRAYKILVERWGKFYITGNHEGDGVRRSELIITTDKGVRVMFVHYDLLLDLFKKTTKWRDYRNREAGSTFWKGIQTWIFDKMDFVKGIRPLPDGFVEFVCDYALSQNCTVISGGHFHVLQQRHYTMNRPHGTCRAVFNPAHIESTVWV